MVKKSKPVVLIDRVDYLLTNFFRNAPCRVEPNGSHSGNDVPMRPMLTRLHPVTRHKI